MEELPEKWCIKLISREINDAVNSLNLRNSLHWENTTAYISHYVGYNGYYSRELVNKGYEEITFDEFKWHILKQFPEKWMLKLNDFTQEQRKIVGEYYREQFRLSGYTTNTYDDPTFTFLKSHNNIGQSIMNPPGKLEPLFGGHSRDFVEITFEQFRENVLKLKKDEKPAFPEKWEIDLKKLNQDQCLKVGKFFDDQVTKSDPSSKSTTYANWSKFSSLRSYNLQDQSILNTSSHLFSSFSGTGKIKYPEITFQQFQLNILEELPEKWCINRDGHQVEIGKWFNEHNQSGQKDYDRRNYEGHIYHYPTSSVHNHSEKKVRNGYTELTWEQFEKLVLKINQKQESIMKKQIGWKMSKDKYNVAALKIANTSNWSDSGKYDLSINSAAETRLKDAGVLDLWFKPVYEQVAVRVGQWITITDSNQFEPGCGGLGVGTFLVVAEAHSQGLHSHEQGFNVRAKDGRIWRINGTFREATASEIPEFKVGDWVYAVKGNINDDYRQIEFIPTFQIKEVTANFYRPTKDSGNGVRKSSVRAATATEIERAKNPWNVGDWVLINNTVIGTSTPAGNGLARPVIAQLLDKSIANPAGGNTPKDFVFETNGKFFGTRKEYIVRMATQQEINANTKPKIEIKGYDAEFPNGKEEVKFGCQLYSKEFVTTLHQLLSNNDFTLADEDGNEFNDDVETLSTWLNR